MQTLYQLTQDFLELQNMMEEGVDAQVIADTMEGLDYEIEEKADGYAKVMKNLQAEADAYGKEIARMKERKEALENHIDRMKHSLEAAMIATGKEKFKTKYFGFNIQNNPPKIVIDRPDMIPAEYLIPQPPKADNKALKEYLMQMKDERSDFAHIERGRGLRIR